MASKKAPAHTSKSKSHFCTTCGREARLTMAQPGRKMVGVCEKGHRHPLGMLILK